MFFDRKKKKNIRYGKCVLDYMGEEVFTVIRVRRSTKDKLDNLKLYPRETYESVMLRMIRETEKKGAVGDIKA